MGTRDAEQRILEKDRQGMTLNAIEYCIARVNMRHSEESKHRGNWDKPIPGDTPTEPTRTPRSLKPPPLPSEPLPRQ